jgi:hypothetical protein
LLQHSPYKLHFGCTFNYNDFFHFQIHSTACSLRNSLRNQFHCRGGCSVHLFKSCFVDSMEDLFFKSTCVIFIYLNIFFGFIFPLCTIRLLFGHHHFRFILSFDHIVQSLVSLCDILTIGYFLHCVYYTKLFNFRLYSNRFTHLILFKNIFTKFILLFSVYCELYFGNNILSL